MRRLSELYHQHLTGLPVTVVLDDAARPGAGAHPGARSAPTAWSWSPRASRSTCPPTSRPGCTSCRSTRWTRRAPRSCCGRRPRTPAGRAVRRPVGRRGSASCAAGCRWRCGSRAPRSARAPARQLAADLGAYGRSDPVERALWLRYTDQPEQARRLLRRLALAGRASLGAAAAAALLADGRAGGGPACWTALARAGPDRPCARQPLPAARPRPGLRRRPGCSTRRSRRSARPRRSG